VSSSYNRNKHLTRKKSSENWEKRLKWVCGYVNIFYIVLFFISRREYFSCATIAYMQQQAQCSLCKLNSLKDIPNALKISYRISTFNTSICTHKCARAHRLIYNDNNNRYDCNKQVRRKLKTGIKYSSSQRIWAPCLSIHAEISLFIIDGRAILFITIIITICRYHDRILIVIVCYD